MTKAIIKKDYSMSIIRMIATISVFLCHVGQQIKCEYLSDWVNIGVQLFFAMSAHLYAKKYVHRPNYTLQLWHTEREDRRKYTDRNNMYSRNIGIRCIYA